MKTRSKALLLILCAMLLLIASALGTVAYLTEQETVTNTFSVGQVNITLNEGSEGNVDENDHILMPGHTYTKDHTIHVDAVSEDSYIFVKVENGIFAFVNTSFAVAIDVATVLSVGENTMSHFFARLCAAV